MTADSLGNGPDSEWTDENYVIRREIHCLTPEGVQEDGEILFVMTSSHDQTVWICEYRFVDVTIVYPPVGNSHGVDALQAFLLCLRKVAMRIDDSVRDGWKAWWLTRDDGCGFKLIKQEPELPEY